MHRYEVRLRPSPLALRAFSRETIDGMTKRLAVEGAVASYRTRAGARRAVADANLANCYTEAFIHDAKTDTALT